jgi:hypothetical protein
VPDFTDIGGANQTNAVTDLTTTVNGNTAYVVSGPSGLLIPAPGPYCAYQIQLLVVT